VLKKQRNTQVLLAEVHDVDVDRKVVKVTQPDDAELEFPYDTLIVAAGATHSYFGNDRFAEFAPGTKTIATCGTGFCRSSRWPNSPLIRRSEPSGSPSS
jgi:NADH dehydrogenase FAD-containing subunit